MTIITFIAVRCLASVSVFGDNRTGWKKRDLAVDIRKKGLRKYFHRNLFDLNPQSFLTEEDSRNRRDETTWGVLLILIRLKIRVKVGDENHFQLVADPLLNNEENTNELKILLRMEQMREI